MFPLNEKKRLQQLFVHRCQLPRTEDLLIHHISSGYFVDLRRKFRRFLICNEDNPRSKLFLKSTAVINDEKWRNLQYSFYMIHPFSKGRVVWEIFMVHVLLILLMFIPIDICMMHTFQYFSISRILLDTMCVIDIFMSFNTGYQDYVNKKVVMNRKAVALYYIKTWFFLDMVSSVNADIFILIFRIKLRKMWYFKIPSFLKVFRCYTLFLYLDRIREWKQFSLYKHNLLKLLIIVMLLVTWNTSILYLIAQQLNASWLPSEVTSGLLLCYFRIIQNFLLVSHGQTNSESMIMLVLEIIWMTIGLVLQIIITAQIVQAFIKYNSLTDKYYQMVHQFKLYMESKNLPEKIQKRVFNYFEFRFQRNYYKEDDILDTLSVQLRQEIIVHMCKEYLEKTIIFHNLPSALLVRISHCMKMEIFLPDDVIVEFGGEADAMYFILTGMVAVFDKDGKEVCHLADGGYFGEVSLFMSHEYRRATVVAVDFCELYALNRDDFLEAIRPYPDLFVRIERISKNRLKAITSESPKDGSTDGLDSLGLELSEENRNF